MSLSALPTELLHIIIDLILPPDWTIHKDKRILAQLRLVCKRFDAIVSYQTLFKVKIQPIHIYHADNKSETTILWLLRLRLELERASQKEPIYFSTSPFRPIKPGKSDQDQNYALEAYFHERGHNLAETAYALVACTRSNEMVNGLLALPRQGEPNLLHEEFLRSKLTVAAYTGDVQFIRSLLDSDPNLDLDVSSQHLGPPLHAAIHSRSLEVVTLLLHKGANPISYFKGETPLSISLQNRHQEMIHLILEHLLYASEQQNLHVYALAISCSLGDLENARLIQSKYRERGGQWRHRLTREYQCALREAADSGYDIVIRWVLEQDDFSASENTTCEALKGAVRRGYAQTVRLLVGSLGLPERIAGSERWREIRSRSKTADVFQALRQFFDSNNAYFSKSVTGRRLGMREIKLDDTVMPNACSVSCIS
ncbi:ankyrin repeat-containing domain protein [Aspergillus avenaceus]|uniref:Ankyrin repeat-containing domain protein n=1 Tax=Aspergillus avenaceus TaxID=36643 RepID=A0A5N6U7W1_ASPAV|nr:ankyrin repeat-containing domain protein [Aspergillus avenaceus]